MQTFPDQWKYRFARGDYVIARADHSFSDKEQIKKGQVYRVLKEATGRGGWDGIYLEEFPNLPMLASRFVPAGNQLPYDAAYYNMITMGDDNDSQSEMAERHQSDLG